MTAREGRLERILEEGISSYPDAEPLAGIEKRIVARIRMAKTRSRSLSGLRVALGSGLLGMVIAASVFVLTLHNQNQPKIFVSETKPSNFGRTPRQTEARQLPIQMSRRLPLVRSQRRLISERICRVMNSPKQRMFPMPSPVTAEEHLLLVLVTRNPDEAARAFESLRQRSNEPVEIAPLVIPPLASGQEQ